MSATRVLEVVIAATFMFYVAALLSSGLVEWLANLMKKRAKYLLRGLRAMLEGNKQTGDLGALTGLVSISGQVGKEGTLYKEAAKTPDAGTADDLVSKVTRHPLVLALAQSKADGTITRLPSYLPARTFVNALFDELRDSTVETDDEVERLKVGIEALGDDSQLNKALQALFRTHGQDIEKLGKAVEGWYDDQMDRVSGAYKRWARRWIIVIGLAVAAVMHLDSIGLVKDLWSDEPARAAIVKAAADTDECQDKTEAEERAECIDNTVATLAGEGPPIGPQAWGDLPDNGEQLLLLLLGIALTGAAASLGAPFWFDALGRLNSLRNSGPKPPKSTDQS